MSVVKLFADKNQEGLIGANSSESDKECLAVSLTAEQMDLIRANMPAGKTQAEFCAELLQAGLNRLEQEQRQREDMKKRFIPPGWLNER